MLGLRSVVLVGLSLINSISVDGADIALGDPYEFFETRNLNETGCELVHLLKNASRQLVASLNNSVWQPGPDYKDRMSPNKSVILDSTNMNDNGVYELRCMDTTPHLNVAQVSDVRTDEGGNVTFPFHYITAGESGKFTVKRNGMLVFELDLSSGEIARGPGFSERLSVSPYWRLEGNLTLTWTDVKLEDHDVYFFYVKGEDRKKHSLSAVRMNVRKRDQIIPSLSPPLVPAYKMDTGCIVGLSVGLPAMLVVGALIGPLLWKRCRSNVLPGRRGGRPSTDVEMGLFTEGGPAPQPNGGS